MVHKAIIKILSVILIVGLNWTGLFAVIETFAYMNDTETSWGNIYLASTLDFSLSSPADFAPSITPSATSSRDISLIKNGILGFQYTASTTNATGTLCDYLDLEAKLDGITVYNNHLTSFNYNAGEFSTSTDDWQFTATLTSNDPSLQNQTCIFDFVFDGVQIGGLGFSDQEIIPNTVTSGTWVEPNPPTTSGYSPIADSYVDQAHPNSNYGSNQELQISSKNPGPENKRAFIKFDFNFPRGTTILSAKLKLYMKDAPPTSRIYEARRVLASWKERDTSGIDWNNQPNASDSPTDSVPSGITNNVWLSWDVTSDVQSFVDGTFTNYGWRLSDSIENSHPTAYEAKFHSRDSNDADKRPVIEITFRSPEATTSYPVINEVYYDVGSEKGSDPDNEWVEIYNPTNEIVNISGWKICDKDACDTLPNSTLIPAKGFVVITNKDSTWDKWIIPSGAVKIVLNSAIGNGLANAGDRIILKNNADAIIDAMSYGNDTTYFELTPSGKGKSLARIVKGYDTNTATDWIINATPNPGTNPSVYGVETLIFTSYGVAVAGYEPVIEENDSDGQEIFEKETTEQKPTIEETSNSNEETSTTTEEITTTEQATITEESSANEELPTDETTAVEPAESSSDIQAAEEQPAIEEQPVIIPDNNSKAEDVPADNGGEGGAGGSGSDGGGSNTNTPSSDGASSGNSAIVSPSE